MSEGSGSGYSSGTSWGVPWSYCYDETVSYPGFVDYRYYGQTYGGGSGEEDCIAYVGDAFTDATGPCSGMFPIAYNDAALLVAYGHSRWPEAQVFFGRNDTGTLGALAETGVSGADAQTAKSASSAVVVATIPSSGGRYVITRTAVKLPDGRVLLYYNVWFYDDMVNLVGLSSTKRLVKQIAMTVDPDEPFAL